jgi:hypothetical protein
MKRMVGVVLLVQESRFQLRDRAGVAHLFILGANAAAEPAQLQALAREQAVVEVQYSPARNTIGNLAERIVLF